MNKEYFINLVKYPISGKARKYIKQYNELQSANKIKLIMTLVVRNEEDILEKNIRFHSAMGVDGFIVVNHKSTDKTSDILEKLKNENIVLDVLEKNSPNHQHHKWVNEMIKLAQKKYKADWVINADADEFYYSKDLDLKKSIYKYSKAGVNALWLDSTMVFPEDVENFWENKFWCVKRLQNFEYEKNSFFKDKKYGDFCTKEVCPKIIHATKGFISTTDGNHYVKMTKLKQVPCSEIVLYHYHVRSYKGFEGKIKRWADSAKYMPNYQGEHIKQMIEVYNAGKLRERFDEYYGEEIRNQLINFGLVAIDNSVHNFMEWKGLI